MAEVHVLAAGYAGDRVGSTVSLIRCDEATIVVDPGMVASQALILDPLERLGIAAQDVTDVVISHHHPDHTINVGLFPRARVHDHWAIYLGDEWISRPAEGFEVAAGVTLWETPGHTPQDITTIVEDDGSVTALTHLWWHRSGPDEDPYATDMAALRAARIRVLEVATLIIPGHGSPFVPEELTRSPGQY